MLKHVPNILTIVRFFLIPFILVFILKDMYIVSAIFLVISGITDVLDGFIARKYNLISNFGKLMDPLADKATQITTLIALTGKGLIPLWIIIIVLIKEVAMVAGASFLYGKNMVVSSKWYGKISTVIFYVAIFLSMLIKEFNLPEIYMQYNQYIYYIGVAFTLFSLIMYFKLFYIKDLNKENNTKNS